jgi:hypothetical protein
VSGAHRPSEHVSSAAHVWHAKPELPHADKLSPSWHTPAKSQQPWQVVAQAPVCVVPQLVSASTSATNDIERTFITR